MTSEERFDQIGRSLAGLIEVQRIQSENVRQLMQLVSGHVDASNARMEANRQAIRDLTETVSKFVEVSDTRMRRIEDNLDALIRAITAEHSNGHGSSRSPQ